MNFRPEMRKVTHVLPREPKASGPMVPPMVPPIKAHPVRPRSVPSHTDYTPGYTPGFTPVGSGPSNFRPSMPPPLKAGSRRTSIEPKAPPAPPEPAAPKAPSAPAASAPSAPSQEASNQGPHERPQVRKRWQEVRERALTLLAAPAASPKNARDPKRRRQSERPRTEGGTESEAVRDRALTLLASSNSDRIKERTKTFIEKHQVDIVLKSESDELPMDDSKLEDDATLEAPATSAQQANLEPDDLPQKDAEPAVQPEPEDKSQEAEDVSPEIGTSQQDSMSPPGKPAVPQVGTPPAAPIRDEVEESQLAQLQAGIFWILGCFFQCLFFSLRLCLCCAKSSELHSEPKRRFGDADGAGAQAAAAAPGAAAVPGSAAPEVPVRFPVGFWSPALDMEQRQSFVGSASPGAVAETAPAAVRRAPRRGVRTRKAAKNSGLYDELEKLEDFFRQEAVFMAKTGSGSN